MQKKKSKPSTKPVSKKKLTPKKKSVNKTKLPTLKEEIKPTKETKFIANEKILIVCGEPSGDLLGADLMKELLNTGSNFTFTGIGGLEMGKSGFTSLYDIESLSVMGFTGILTRYFELKRIVKNLVEKAIEQNVHYAVLIDYPGFNLYLAERLREKGIKVIFYVSPQIWAWRFKRIYKIKEFVNLMLVLFPFEKKIYDEYSVKCEFVGHPLKTRMIEKINTEKSINIEKGITTICLMPGSRGVEIDRLLDPILESAILINNRMHLIGKKVQFILPNINKSKESLILEKLEKIKTEKKLDIKYFFDSSAKCIEASDLVILSSGTATLEVTFFEKPMIILYKVGFFTYNIGRRIVSAKFFGLPNVLSERIICKEYLQKEVTPETIFTEAKQILENDPYRNEMIENIRKVKQSLGDGHAGKNAAKAILKLIQESVLL